MRPSPGRQVMVLHQPSSVTARPGRARLLRRRRNTLVALAAANVVTALLALVVGGAAWLLFLLSAGALGAYVMLLAQLRADAQRRMDTVRPIPARRTAARPPDHLIRRAG